MAQNPTKVLQKEITKAETAQKQQLKDAQKAEIKFLKAEGATKAELAAEKAANKTEFAGAKSLLATDGLQYVPQRAENGFITSDVGTYQDTYAGAIQPKIEQAIGLLSQYNIPVPGKLPYGMRPPTFDLVEPSLPNDTVTVPPE